MVASNPQKGTVLETGEQIFTITYDKNIYFSSAKFNQIQFTGGDVLSAVVYGASPTLTVTVNVKDNENPSNYQKKHLFIS
jgi:hypothetical protein